MWRPLRTLAGSAGLWLGLFLSAVLPDAATPQGLNDRVIELEQQVADLRQRISILERLSQPLDLTVDCAAGETVAGALAKAAGRITPVSITIAGVCTERVFLSRNDVTLQGASPGSGLQSPSPEGILLELHGARNIVLSQLTLTGGSQGLFATAGASFTAWSLVVRAPSLLGIYVNLHSTGTLHDCTIRDSGGNGIRADLGGGLIVDGGVIESSGVWGAFAESNGFLDLRGVFVRNNPNAAAFVNLGGSIQAVDSTFEGSHVGLQVNQGGSASLDNTLIHDCTLGLSVHGSSVTLISSRILDNERPGISIYNGGRVALEGRTVIENNGSGLLLTGGASVRDNGGVIIRNNEGDGIYLQDTSVVDLASPSSQITGNLGWGILCAPPPAVAQISGAAGVISGNGQGAIHCPGVPSPQ